MVLCKIGHVSQRRFRCDKGIARNSRNGNEMTITKITWSNYTSVAFMFVFEKRVLFKKFLWRRDPCKL